MAGRRFFCGRLGAGVNRLSVSNTETQQAEKHFANAAKANNNVLYSEFSKSLCCARYLLQNGKGTRWLLPSHRCRNRCPRQNLAASPRHAVAGGTR